MSAATAAFKAAKIAFGTNADLANDATRQLVAAFVQADKHSVGRLKGNLMETWPPMVQHYGETHVQIAREQYQRIREGYGLRDGYNPTIDFDQLYDTAAKMALADIDDGTFDDAESSADYLSGRMTEHVYGITDIWMQSWCRRDPRHPRWALVPEPGACAWCLMLASRGFVYVSEDTMAPARHPHCRCTPTIDFSDSASLESYMPRELYDAFRRAFSHTHDIGHDKQRNQALAEINRDNGYWKDKAAKRSAGSDSDK